MNDPAAVLGGAAAVLLAAAFAIRAIAQARQAKAEPAKTDFLIEQMATRLDTANDTLQHILEALHGFPDSLENHLKQLRVDMRHDVRGELTLPVNQIAKVQDGVTSLLQRRR